MAEKPEAQEVTVPDTSELIEAIQQGTATPEQMKKVRDSSVKCPVCSELRGSGPTCQSCGQR